jgi:YegS/Rv2252/BmrU family lipid kinase
VTQPTPRRLAVVIGNPAAGASGSSIIRSAAAFLRRRARRVEVGITRARGDAEALCREAVGEGADMVVAAGGDGTINEVVNGMAGSSAALGVVPLGTANVLALETGIPTDPERACRLLLEGRPRPVHLGLAGSRHFVLMAGAGFDSLVIYSTSGAAKKRLGKGAYIAAGLRSLLTARVPILAVTIPGAEPVTGTGIVIGNGRLYGGRFSVTPGARLDEPRLEVCLFKGRRRIDWAGYAWGVLRGRHGLYDGVSLFKTDRLRVSSEEKVHVQADGDLVGTLPMDFAVAPYTLNLILPEAAA